MYVICDTVYDILNNSSSLTEPQRTWMQQWNAGQSSGVSSVAVLWCQKREPRLSHGNEANKGQGSREMVLLLKESEKMEFV